MKRILAALMLCLTLCFIFTSCKSWGDAPSFTFYDEEGSATELSSLLGKKIVLNFWTSWCPPCKLELPYFEQAYQEYGDEVEFLMVNLTGWEYSQDDGKEYIDETGYTFPVYYDLYDEASEAYEIESIPWTYFIDENGNISYKHNGMITYEELEEKIKNF